MNRISKALIVVVASGAIAAGFFATASRLEAAPPDAGSKTIQIVCKPGLRASAVGQYGGVSFGVDCNNGKGNTKISGAVGTAYSFRMGVESDTGAFDCAFSGDAAVVQETCVNVLLSIR